ncbi:MAG: glutaredoxin [Eubacteriaceae bacterium]|jgi:glutaredoxin-related protein|nr:glutaredoxin [Eubacteriaceae bacterium]
MKFTIVGSHLCLDTQEALEKCSRADMDFEFSNISDSLDDLKFYLKLRENDPMYEEVIENGNLGIPLFISENGEKTFDLDKVLEGWK